MSKNISRRSFLKGAAGVAGATALGVLAGTGSAFAEEAAQGVYTPGTYKSVQTTPYATVEVSCTFSETALTDVSYEVLKTSESDYFTPFANPMKAYCERIVAAGKTEGIDGVTGASFSSDAIKAGVDDCKLQALGLNATVKAPVNDNPQDWNFDSFESDLSAVFSPIKLGKMELPNRVIKSAGGMPWTDAAGSNLPPHAEVYTRMAENEVSLVLATGYMLLFSALVPDYLDLAPDVDAALAQVKPMVDGVHKAGGKIGYQMTFYSIAPTVEDDIINNMTKEEIDAYLDRLGIVVQRAVDLGFDCMEVKGASADALNSFLTRRVNKREDEYGPQSIENRTRLFRQIIQKIKEVAGQDFPVGALIDGVEENDENLGSNEYYTTIEESQQIAKALVDAGADWIQVRVGAKNNEMNIWAPDLQHIIEGEDGLTSFGTKFDYSSHYGGMVDGSHSGFGSFIPIARAIKEVVDVPVGCAGYLDLRVGPDFLNAAIENGDIDLIFMCRPLSCDPTLVKKMHERRREDIIPCSRCMNCHDWIGSGNVLQNKCRMNPTQFNSLTDVMPEGMDPLPAETIKNVMVIGAGPGGLEAAKIASQRGHKVSIYEKEDKIGGLLHFANGVKGPHERLEDVVTYYRAQLEKNGVEVNLRTAADLETVKTVNPDAVVVAVGATRKIDLEGTASTPVLSPEDAFGSAQLGDTVVFNGATVQAVDFAAYLCHLGKKLIVINPGTYDDVDKGQAAYFKQFIMAHIQAHGVKFYHNAAINSVGDGFVEITTDVGLTKKIPCNSVVDFTTVPNTELADEIEAAGYEVYKIGDCNEPLNIQQAIYDGHMTARHL